MSLELITIGISCYNAHDTIAKAIESALAQDWLNKEILIVDDASTDSSVDAIKSVVAGTNNVRVIEHKENRGFAGVLNTLISEARGSFLSIFDDDDVSVPERVRMQHGRIVRYEQKYRVNLIVCHSARLQKFAVFEDRYEPTMGTAETQMAPHGLDVVDRILIGRLSPNIEGSCANCSRMARIEVFKHVGGYDESMRRGQDTDFNIRLGFAGGHFAGIAVPLVTQKMTIGDEKSLYSLKNAEKRLLDKNKAYLVERGWYEFCSKWLEARYAYLSDNSIGMVYSLLWLLIRSPVKFVYKVLWALPAHSTRKSVKFWYGRG